MFVFWTELLKQMTRLGSTDATLQPLRWIFRFFMELIASRKENNFLLSLLLLVSVYCQLTTIVCGNFPFYVIRLAKELSSFHFISKCIYIMQKMM